MKNKIFEDSCRTILDFTMARQKLLNEAKLLMLELRLQFNPNSEELRRIDELLTKIDGRN